MSDTTSPSPTPRKKKRSPFLIGCLAIVALFVIIVGLGLVWFVTKGKVYLAEAVHDSVVEEIEKSGLPEDQQAALKHEIGRLTEGVKSGEIGFSKLGTLAEEIDSSPVVATIFLYGAKSTIEERANLTPDERREADRHIRRFIFGVFEERIPESAVDTILNPLLKNGDRSQLELRSNLTESEIRSAIAQAKAYADQAGIREDEIHPDLAGEIREIIDKLLASQ